MIVTIDTGSGFCFGVVNAIKAADIELEKSGYLYCLGDIVHNTIEVARLKTKGLEIIDYKKFKNLKNCKVLIRAHGEPPETYEMAKKNNIKLIDASCVVVKKLQNKIKDDFEKMKTEGGQIVIYGKKDHPEVIGLAGQTEYKAIVVESIENIDKIDFTKPVRLYAQTTKSVKEFKKISSNIQNRMKSANKGKQIYFIAIDSICRQVSNRAPKLKEFSQNNDVIIFVTDKKSSNGKFLYKVCKEANPNSHFVSEVADIKKEWFKGFKTIGLCGATSTPLWLMEEISKGIKGLGSALISN